MFWYGLLNVLMTLFALVAGAAFIGFILTGCDMPGLLLAAFLIGAIAVGCGFGTMSIEEANTTTYTDVVEMEITKCDITSVSSTSTSDRTICYITVGDEHLIEVSPEEYAKLNVGDIVPVTVETKTTFGKTTRSASLG